MYHSIISKKASGYCKNGCPYKMFFEKKYPESVKRVKSVGILSNDGKPDLRNKNLNIMKIRIYFKVIILFAIMVFASNFQAQELEPYRLYNSNGEKVDFASMLKAMSQSDVVLFGEIHNNSICHWIELRVAKGLYGIDTLLQIGAEMYEADNQLILDEYMQGLIKTSYFESEMRLWKNYKTDYKPVLEFARENHIGMYATNIPRRYAGLVAQKGFEGLKLLSDEARKYIAPLPVAFDTLAPNYDEMMSMDTGHGMNININFVKAQAIKDATMAYFIAKYLKEGYTFVHYQGDFHSKNHGAILWYLNKYKPGLKVTTLSTQEADDLEFKEEYKKKADFILVTPKDITKTY